MISIIISSIRKRGLFETIKFIAYELSFDLKYKTNTAGYIELDSLDVTHKNKEHGAPYQAYNYYLLKLFFEQFKDRIQNSVFMDFGSGKGRVLMLSAIYGAKKSIGIEFSKELVDVCIDNLDAFRKNSKYDTEICVINADASEYKDLEDVDIFFFYNPFNETVMQKVLKNIGEQAGKDKKIMLVYISPVCGDLFEAHGFTLIYSYNNDLMVYQN